jgi:hypothetical protein
MRTNRTRYQIFLRVTAEILFLKEAVLIQMPHYRMIFCDLAQSSVPPQIGPGIAYVRDIVFSVPEQKRGQSASHPAVFGSLPLFFINTQIGGFDGFPQQFSRVILGIRRQYNPLYRLGCFLACNFAGSVPAHPVSYEKKPGISVCNVGVLI